MRGGDVWRGEDERGSGLSRFCADDGWHLRRIVAWERGRPRELSTRQTPWSQLRNRDEDRLVPHAAPIAPASRYRQRLTAGRLCGSTMPPLSILPGPAPCAGARITPPFAMAFQPSEWHRQSARSAYPRQPWSGRADILPADDDHLYASVYVGQKACEPQVPLGEGHGSQPASK